MIGLPFIYELFKNILSESKAIEGRFFYCPKMGKEINTDDLDQVIKDAFSQGETKRFPCSIMMPPVSNGKFVDPKGEWEYYDFILFFLKTTYYTGDNQIANVNPNTQTSTHTVLQDQHDMGRSARNFIGVVERIARTKGLIKNKFRLSSDHDRIIRPVANIGTNRLSGVRLDFTGSVFNGCTIEDYTEDGIDEIIIPDCDSHPEHKL
jgi:hypothetical protein